MKRKPKGALTPKRRDFVDRFIAGGMKDRIAAYRAAFRSKGNDATCHKEATRLLAVPAIAELVETAQRKAEAATGAVLERYAVNRERIVAELARLGFSNMLDYVSITGDGQAYVDLSALDRDQAAAIAEIVVDEYTEGRGEDARDVKRVRVKLGDKRAALMDLAKLEGFVIDKSEFKGDVTNKVISAEPLTDAEWERKYGSNGKA